MNELSENPYASPEADCPATTARTGENRLLPLWVWLGISVLASFFVAPADPTSMLIATVYGVVCFFFGALAGFHRRALFRVLILVICLVPIAILVFLSAGADPTDIRLHVELCYGLASAMFGFSASRNIKNGQVRIIACFCAGYLLGSIVGGLGTIAGAVLGVFLANRSLAKPAGG